MRIHGVGMALKALSGSRSMTSSARGPITRGLGIFAPRRVIVAPGREEVMKFEPSLKQHRLPLLTQLSAFHTEDFSCTNWEDPVEFLRKNHAVVCTYNPLIQQRSRLNGRDNFLAIVGRKLLKNLIDLVCENRARGYCIGEALVAENMVVSPLLGTFRLKNGVAEDITGKERAKFLGFKQVRTLFEGLLKEAFGADVMRKLTLDVQMLMQTLDKDASEKEYLGKYHASLLTLSGRAWLSIRIASMLRTEIRAYETNGNSSVNSIYKQLGFLGNIDCLHPFFAAWHDHSRNLPAKNEDQQQQLSPPNHLELDDETKETNELRAAGRWIVDMHRNGVLHHHGPHLSKACGGKKYGFSDVIELLHLMIPIYLPTTQTMFDYHGFWDWLDMPSCSSEETVPYYQSRKGRGSTV